MERFATIEVDLTPEFTSFLASLREKELSVVDAEVELGRFCNYDFLKCLLKAVVTDAIDSWYAVHVIGALNKLMETGLFVYWMTLKVQRAIKYAPTKAKMPFYMIMGIEPWQSTIQEKGCLPVPVCVKLPLGTAFFCVSFGLEGPHLDGLQGVNYGHNLLPVWTPSIYRTHLATQLVQPLLWGVLQEWIKNLWKKGLNGCLILLVNLLPSYELPTFRLAEDNNFYLVYSAVRPVGAELINFEYYQGTLSSSLLRFLWSSLNQIREVHAITERPARPVELSSVAEAEASTSVMPPKIQTAPDTVKAGLARCFAAVLTPGCDRDVRDDEFWKTNCFERAVAGTSSQHREGFFLEVYFALLKDFTKATAQNIMRSLVAKCILTAESDKNAGSQCSENITDVGPHSATQKLAPATSVLTLSENATTNVSLAPECRMEQHLQISPSAPVVHPMKHTIAASPRDVTAINSEVTHHSQYAGAQQTGPPTTFLPGNPHHVKRSKRTEISPLPHDWGRSFQRDKIKFIYKNRNPPTANEKTVSQAMSRVPTAAASKKSTKRGLGDNLSGQKLRKRNKISTLSQVSQKSHQSGRSSKKAFSNKIEIKSLTDKFPNVEYVAPPCRITRGTILPKSAIQAVPLHRGGDVAGVPVDPLVILPEVTNKHNVCEVPQVRKQQNILPTAQLKVEPDSINAGESETDSNGYKSATAASLTEATGLENVSKPGAQARKNHNTENTAKLEVEPHPRPQHLRIVVSDSENLESDDICSSEVTGLHIPEPTKKQDQVLSLNSNQNAKPTTRPKEEPTNQEANESEAHSDFDNLLETSADLPGVFSISEPTTKQGETSKNQSAGPKRPKIEPPEVGDNDSDSSACDGLEMGEDLAEDPLSVNVPDPSNGISLAPASTCTFTFPEEWCHGGNASAFPVSPGTIEINEPLSIELLEHESRASDCNETTEPSSKQSPDESRTSDCNVATDVSAAKDYETDDEILDIVEVKVKRKAWVRKVNASMKVDKACQTDTEVIDIELTD